MALFDETFVQEISQLVHQRYAELGTVLGVPEETQTLALDSPLRRNLALLMRVANGEQLRSHASKAVELEIEAALQQLITLLFGNVLQTHVDIPDSFWQTAAGTLVSRVRWWLSADSLITISNAAALAYGENTQANRMRIARAMDKGRLAWVPDPSVANPQQNRRVLREQVEQLREQTE